jgi:hypothetical protein
MPSVFADHHHIFGSNDMLDVILIAAGCGCFVVAIAYTYACDRF